MKKTVSLSQAGDDADDDEHVARMVGTDLPARQPRSASVAAVQIAAHPS
jgi:hypothetical protein